MLGNIIGCIENISKNVITKFFEGSFYYPVCISLVMVFKIFYIFKQEGFWSLFSKYFGDSEKQRSLCLILKSVLFSKAFLLGNTCDRKRLTRKSSRKNIVIRYFFRFYFVDVTVGNLTEIFKISLLAPSVPFRGKDAFASVLSKDRRIPPMPAKRSMNVNL